MTRLRDLTGQKFGRLTILQIDITPRPDLKKKTVRWLCQCDCGNVISATSCDITRGHTNSCGCYQKYRAGESLTKLKSQNIHFHKSKTKSYRIWRAMMSRCYNSNFHYYHYYGGRGIGVCQRWHDYFNFLADMGEPDDDLSLDRIDNNKGYSPENCRWATKIEQANNRRSNRNIVFHGERMSVAMLCRKENLPYVITMGLLKRGKNIEDIINMIRSKKSNNDETRRQDTTL